MTEEIKNENNTECKCFCKSEAFRNFLTIALGSFVGVYFALSLFAALHKPPMMPPQAFAFQRMKHGCPCEMIKHHHHHFVKGERPYNVEFQKPNFDTKGPMPFEAQHTHTTK